MVSKSRQPLYQMKADFFKTLAHPARIRVLELLSDRDYTVSQMLPEVAIEPANLSQQLSVLRRAGLVTGQARGSVGVLHTDVATGGRAAGCRAGHPHRGRRRPG